MTFAIGVELVVGDHSPAGLFRAVVSDLERLRMPANNYGEPKAAQHRRGTRSILNESWPLRDKVGEHARGIEDQPDPIDVEVRIEWAGGGEEWLPGRAHRWTASHVFVRFQDPRSATGFVWVRARDVRR